MKSPAFVRAKNAALRRSRQRALVPALLALALASPIFFSCASTDGAASKPEALSALEADGGAALENGGADSAQGGALAEGEGLFAGEDSPAQKENGTETAAEKIDGGEAPGLSESAAPEEKIPQSELDEWEAFLEDGENGDSGTDGAQNAASLNGPDSSGTNSAHSDGIAKSQDGSLLEKIRGSNGTEDARPSADSSFNESERGGAFGGQNDSASRNSGGEESAAAFSSERPDESAAPSRTTSQGNEFQGGPLIGPGADRQSPGGASANTSRLSSGGAAARASNNSGLDGRDRAESRAAGNNSSNGTQGGRSSSAAAPYGETQGASDEANEGIALAIPKREEDESETAPEERAEPVPSRSMAIKNNQFVDIAYPGSGWIYLGEEGSGDHFIFQGRRLSDGETTFTLRSKEPGTALLHFYKNDILTGNYIDDYIEISVGEKSASDSVHEKAPSYAEAVPPKFERTKAKEPEQKNAARDGGESGTDKSEAVAASARGGQSAAAKAPEAREGQAESAPSEKVQTVIQTSEQEKAESGQRTSVAGRSAESGKSESAKGGQERTSVPSAQTGASGQAKSLLERAQKAYDEKRYEDALDLVQQFFDAAAEDFDAGLYLEGLILEAKSSARNIKSAIDAYDTLIKNWPQSQYWRRANERSIYLKRFYIDIR